MKTLHLSIIAIVGVLIIVLTSVGVFMKKLDDNSGPLDTGVMITGVKENYTLNEPITFSVMVDGYGSGCGDTKAILTKENDSQYKSQVWGAGRQCASFSNPTNFEFTGLSANTTINQAGNYTITASFDDSVTYRHIITEEKFSVIGPKITSIFDTGIVPMSNAVVNTNFTINYNIVGGQVSEIKKDMQSKSIIVFLNTTGDGQLVIDLPRTLIDSKTYGNMDDAFIVLANMQEIKYKEIHNTLDARTLLISFQKGIDKIEIIGTTPI
ncbi:MAG: hypothetical protein KGI05_01765 [Thaumarchaeota archaeon]|nr:hypothetical protein [Nitrososphaerota archaeon]